MRPEPETALEAAGLSEYAMSLESVDTSFSADGKQTTDFGGGDAAHGVALQPDGNIVAVGRGLGTDLTSDFALARYLGG